MTPPRLTPQCIARPGTLDAVGHALGVRGDWQLAQSLGCTFDDLQDVRYNNRPMTLLLAMQCWHAMDRPASFWTWFDPYEPEGDLNVSADRAA